MNKKQERKIIRDKNRSRKQFKRFVRNCRDLNFQNTFGNQAFCEQKILCVVLSILDKPVDFGDVKCPLFMVLGV